MYLAFGKLYLVFWMVFLVLGIVLGIFNIVFGIWESVFGNVMLAFFVVEIFLLYNADSILIYLSVSVRCIYQSLQKAFFRS